MEAQTEPVQSEKILITLDQSSQSKEVLKRGIDLATKMNASIVLLSVVDNAFEFSTPDAAMLFAAELENRLQVAAEEMSNIVKQYPECHFHTISIVGNPKEEIIAQANDTHATMILVGTHGRTGLTHFFLGSTAEYVIRHSTVPVLVAPYQKQKH